MEQRNNLVPGGQRPFRKQLDNLALENGALVLDKKWAGLLYAQHDL